MLEKVILISVIFAGIAFSICYMIAKIVDLKCKLQDLNTKNKILQIKLEDSNNENEILKHKVQNQIEVIKLQRGVR